jgi:hypothetical protein
MPYWRPTGGRWQWKPHIGKAHTRNGAPTGLTLFGISKITDDLPLILVELPTGRRGPPHGGRDERARQLRQGLHVAAEDASW